MNPTEIKDRRHSLLAIFCIGHAGLITAFVMYALPHPESRIADIHLWLALICTWPIWVLVLWRYGWRPKQIILTMIVGLVVLSPALFYTLLILGLADALAHGGSLG